MLSSAPETGRAFLLATLPISPPVRILAAMKRIPSAWLGAVVLLMLAGCRSTPPTFELQAPRWSFDFDVNQFLTGPPKTELNLAELGFDALAAVNHDHFFPPDTQRALISDQAAEAGLFHLREPLQSTLYGRSPDGAWHTAGEMMQGTLRAVLNLEQLREGRRYHFWSTGSFTALYWAPDSRRFAATEVRLDGRRNTFLIDTLELDQQRIDIRTDELDPFIAAAQFARATQNEFHGWLNPTQFLHWVFGAPDENGLPRWGVEFVIDATLPPPALNARVLRAYVRD